MGQRKRWKHTAIATLHRCICMHAQHEQQEALHPASSTPRAAVLLQRRELELLAATPTTSLPPLS